MATNVGTTVQYWWGTNGSLEAYAAIITKVYSADEVDLVVFGDMEPSRGTSVKRGHVFRSDTPAQGDWNWIPAV